MWPAVLDVKFLAEIIEFSLEVRPIVGDNDLRRPEAVDDVEEKARSYFGGSFFDGLGFEPLCQAFCASDDVPVESLRPRQIDHEVDENKLKRSDRAKRSENVSMLRMPMTLTMIA